MSIHSVLGNSFRNIKNILNFVNIQHYILFILSACQPVVKQVKSCFDDVKTLYKEESDKIDTKIEALLQIQRDCLELDWQRLEFECEKAGLPPGYCKFFIKSLKISHLVTPPELFLWVPGIGSSIFTSVSSSSPIASKQVSPASSSIRHQLCSMQQATTH